MTFFLKALPILLLFNSCLFNLFIFLCFFLYQRNLDEVNQILAIYFYDFFIYILTNLFFLDLIDQHKFSQFCLEIFRSHSKSWLKVPEKCRWNFPIAPRGNRKIKVCLFDLSHAEKVKMMCRNHSFGLSSQ
jgi:hypothetical protein